MEKYQGRRQAAKFVSRTFADWGVPVLRAGQYTVPLMTAGFWSCATRSAARSGCRGGFLAVMKRPVHDLILKLLGGVSDGKIRIEFFPCIHCAACCGGRLFDRGRFFTHIMDF